MKTFLSFFLLATLALAAPSPAAQVPNQDTNVVTPEIPLPLDVTNAASAATTTLLQAESSTSGVPATPYYYNTRRRFPDYFGRGQPPPVIFSDLELKAGETNSGDAIVIHGTSEIDGFVDGHSITILGDATINGTVTGDVQVILGSLTLGPRARIGGEVDVIGGAVEKAPGARIRDSRINVIIGKNPIIQGLLDWFTKGLLLGRPFPPEVHWVWVVAGLCLLVNVLLLAMFPRPIDACVAMMEQKTVTSIFAGILGKMLAGLFVTLLCVSVVGLIVVPFVIAACFVATLFGGVTTYRYVGQQLGQMTGVTFLRSPVVALVLGSAVFYFLYMVPYLGFLALSFCGFFGFGAVVLATYQQIRAERATPPAPIYLGDPPASTPPSAPSEEPHAPAPASPPPVAVFTPPRETTSSLASLALPRAGFWLRFCATALDGALFLITIGVFIHPRNMDREMFGLDGWNCSVILWLAYHVFMWKTRATTVGGIIVGLRVIRLDGRPLDFPVVVIRALASVLSFFVLGLGFFWAGFGAEKQGWHDKLAGTVIVRMPRAMSLV